MAAGLRSARERMIQTLWFEGGGLVLVAPAYAMAMAAPAGASFRLIAALSVAVMTWAALYNTVFDIVERRRTGRVASDRPHGLRTLHAIGLEVSSVVVTWPLVWALTPLSWWGALAADLGLSLVYAAYGYVFHWVFDQFRPVPRAADGASVVP